MNKFIIILILILIMVFIYWKKTQVETKIVVEEFKAMELRIPKSGEKTSIMIGRSQSAED